jgi:hypothetical protein
MDSSGYKVNQYQGSESLSLELPDSRCEQNIELI